MIYLDSSALLKLLIEEQESAELAGWLTERQDTPWVSSELAVVEVARVGRRVDPALVASARALLSQLDLIPLTGGLIVEAGEAGDSALRTLDALHLVSAVSIGEDLSAFVAYDLRRHDAAEVAGLPVTQPGR